MTSARVRAVFFDIGDTLVCRPSIGPGRRIAAALDLGDEGARAIGHLIFRTPITSPVELAERVRRDLGLGLPPDRIMAAVTEIWRAQIEEPVEIEGATACVRAVHDARVHVGAISNIWAPYAAGFRRACPVIVPLIVSWHLSYEVGIAKPDPALFLAALQAARADPAEAVMVGDDWEKDVQPALRLGMQALWVGADARRATSEPPSATGRESAPPRDLPAACRVATDLGDARRILDGVLGKRGATG